MNTNDHGPLGARSAYPQHYDASLLFPIERAAARRELGLDPAALPFGGVDIWNAYELSWLDGRGKPQVALGQLRVPAHSPRLVESKSLKLYLNSLNGARFDSAETLRARVIDDLARAAGAPVAFAFGLPPLAAAGDDGQCLDDIEADFDRYGPPAPELLAADPDTPVEEHLCSALLKSNCPVTGQPDWGSVHLHYRGPRIERSGLLRYLVSFRDHAGFHEQCVEQIFLDLLRHCRPTQLSVEARYTRRGGLDINPWRGTPGCIAPPALRDPRQ